MSKGGLLKQVQVVYIYKFYYYYYYCYHYNVISVIIIITMLKLYEIHVIDITYLHFFITPTAPLI